MIAGAGRPDTATDSTADASPWCPACSASDTSTDAASDTTAWCAAASAATR